MFQTDKARVTLADTNSAKPTRRGALRLLTLGFAAATATMISARTARARIFTGFIEGTAVGGYDAVAYHTQGEAVPGDPAITLEHEGATWRFSSEANRAAFAADPDAYAPEYGGHCAWATAQGYLAQGDPEIWRIFDGRLFLNATQGVNRRWLRDVDGFIMQADANWPSLK
ncbi:MAG: tat pathway signal sequence domain protein [Rhizobiales bacterium]|nr:tat pathway signal sequence domain protein [Hyphomicrobiales bacterium]MBO6697669.1 tat pathway signal sequence domain protein [Hyphomicrobiales bacterium]MBO6736076.1 tat pathway signal sequence domain protein [Hyphomicrobiales bacterium]MBO6912546.1 tat pathway signal sequence domain protein [Hyphomicrobiales bacterium]MBO6956946.1 tat pathway signal sequence domain protein [Hyphomicrobiales bacterium]